MSPMEERGKYGEEEDGDGGGKRMKKGERKEYSANSSSPKQEYHIRKDLL